MRSMAIRPRHRPRSASGAKRSLSGALGVIGPVLLLLGLAATVAQAKDRPKSVGDARATVSAPTGCEVLGPGFRKLDGLDTCVKIGGEVRIESGYIAGAGRAISEGSGPQR